MLPEGILNASIEKGPKHQKEEDRDHERPRPIVQHAPAHARAIHRPQYLRAMLIADRGERRSRSRAIHHRALEPSFVSSTYERE